MLVWLTWLNLSVDPSDVTAFYISGDCIVFVYKNGVTSTHAVEGDLTMEKYASIGEALLSAQEDKPKLAAKVGVGRRRHLDDMPQR